MCDETTEWCVLVFQVNTSGGRCYNGVQDVTEMTKWRPLTTALHHIRCDTPLLLDTYMSGSQRESSDARQQGGDQASTATRSNPLLAPNKDCAQLGAGPWPSAAADPPRLFRMSRVLLRLLLLPPGLVAAAELPLPPLLATPPPPPPLLLLPGLSWSLVGVRGGGSSLGAAMGAPERCIWSSAFCSTCLVRS